LQKPFFQQNIVNDNCYQNSQEINLLDPAILETNFGDLKKVK